MARARSEAQQAASRPRRTSLLAAILLVLVLGIAVALVTPALLERYRPSRPTAGGAGPDAALEADTNAVMKACAIGIDQTARSEVRAGLNGYFRGLEGAARVTSAEIGAIAEKVTDKDVGPTLYGLYTDCLKQQMAIALSRRGVTIQPADAAEIEARREQDLRDAVALVGPDTPSARLVQIFGQPVSERTTRFSRDGEEPETAYRFVSYVAPMGIFADEIYSEGTRLAVILRYDGGERDKAQQLRLNRQGSPAATMGLVRDCEGGFEYNVHLNVRSGVCGGSHADDYQYRIFLFLADDLVQAKDADRACYPGADDNASQFTPERCPGLSRIRASAVVMSRDADQADTAGDVYFYKINYSE